MTEYVNIKRILTYVALGTVLLLNISLFVSNGQAAEHNILSFVSQADKDGPNHLMLMDTQGEMHRSLLIPDLKRLRSVTWSSDGRSFVCSSDQGGNFDIYVMDVRKNTYRQLTFDGSRDLSPAWSPNGKWIAFISERAGGTDIYRMDVNGENVIQLTNQGNCDKPAWSPDSRWIAFTSAPEKSYSLFVMRADGGRMRKLADHVPLPGCTWAPDGKQIAFVSRGAERKMEIFRIDVDGKQLRQLTWSDQEAFIFEPTWSPNGKWIAYTSWEIPVRLLKQEFAVNVEIPTISIVDATDGGRGRPVESTIGWMAHSLDWVPSGFFDVSPSADKQTTFWGRLKQTEK